MDREVDFAGEGLLDGLEGDARAARLDLLRRLSGEGVTLQELGRAVAQDRLALLPLERVLARDVRIGSSELSRLCGLDLEFVVAVRRALGLPQADADEPVFRKADVEAFRELGSLRREMRLADDAVLEVLAVAGRSLWKISETALAVVDEAVSGTAADEADLAARYAQAARRLGTVAGPLLEGAMHAQVREGVRGESVTPDEIRSGRIDDTWTVSVCFVDLVGFTQLGHGRPPAEANDLARRLERLATDVARAPVRLVKTMGDGAMLVSTEAGPLLDAALELRARSVADTILAPVRIGIAHGEAFARGGDWYGATVNLAGRVVDLAEPGTILVTRSARDAVSGRYGWSPARRERVRGVADAVELFTVHEQSDVSQTVSAT